MLEVVAKKYTKALIESLDGADLSLVLEDFKGVVGAFSVDKFLDIINSPYVPRAQKCEFLLTLMESKNEKITNFIKLLAENNRLDMIPFVYGALQLHINETNQSYIGLLYLNEDIDASTIDAITRSLAGRLGVGLEIQKIITEIEGIKLVINGLGIEVSFSRDNFLNELKSYILKAI
ncbi:hypothetical protein BKH46_00530 [Helicobacter sp. 12S02634-8]|uniref:F0F1 ATP synthase subunit delta n=1 Tax=Helicobacter sp. 12S02634-8 TaxID=1476199 RepID=UPI000BA62611|nr:F0F1 ATP synthase subunit delta [Helicobacter sp. 12S02634-8]PAF48432.1 hypothetical protein BKH46_00530 [Helicobacter sp. 12S02634-8]